MPFVQGKCPECGGILAVDNGKRAAICQFCGEPFVVQDAINNYNNVPINTPAQEDPSKDFVISGGVLTEYRGASTEVVIPEGVVAIEGGVFQDSAITKVTLPSSLRELRSTYIGTFSGVSIGPFYNCKYLEEIVISDGLKYIPCNAFLNCSSLKSVSVPNSVTDISFKNCRNLKTINIPDGTISIYFENCGLKNVNVPNGVKDIKFKYCYDLESVNIPESVASIGDEAFCGCNSLKSVVIPNSVTKIGVRGFSHCTSLESVIIPDSVTSIAAEAFSGCIGFTSIIVPDSVIEIGVDAFIGCKNLKSVKLSKNLKSIDRRVFRGCIGIETVEKPDSIHFGDVAPNESPYSKRMLIELWKSKGLCQHCGGAFKGFLSSKCTNCGKPKDY